MNELCTFTKCNRAKISAVSISFRMHGCYTANEMRLATSPKSMNIEVISRSHKVSCSREVALPSKNEFPMNSALSGGGHERSQAD